jgi:hypothetical protein
MANQPDFNRLTESFRAITDKIGLINNLPSINDRQLAQTRQDEFGESHSNIATGYGCTN